MLKKSLSRNTRAKGIRVKHVLQILLLLGISIWLIFQVKHSREKKKELNDDQVLMLGRKDLDPRIEKIERGENQDKEEENQETEKVYEVGENDRKKTENEADDDAEFIDDDKEKDDGEEESERDEKQVEEENSSEEHDHDGGDENTRGAREEHYKGDDASSAVTHDTHSINSQTEEVISDLNHLEHEQKSTESEESNGAHDRTTENGNPSNVDDLDKMNTKDGSPQSSILPQHPQANGSVLVRTEGGNDSIENPASQQTDTQNLTTNISMDGMTGSHPVLNNTHSDLNLTISLKDETGNGTAVVLSDFSSQTESNRSTEIGSGPSESKKNVGTKPGEGEDDLKNGSENHIRDDPVVYSDSHSTHEMHETRLDLDSLGEIRTENGSSDETAAA